MKRTIAIILALALILLASACGIWESNPDYAGTYTLVYESGDDYSFFGDDDVRLELYENGKGLDISGREEWDLQWSVRGNTVTIHEGILFGTYTGKMYDGFMVFADWEDSYRVYALDGVNVPDSFTDGNSPDSGDKPAAEPKPTAGIPPAENADLSWWTRDWYGWWQISNATGDYTEWYDSADCGASFEVGEDGICTLYIWDKDWYDRYDGVAAIEVGFSEDGSSAYSTGGWFVFRELGYADIVITRDAESGGSTLVFSGHYVDKAGSFDFRFMLRPWGERWDDVEAANLPSYYHNWYLPLLEAGAKFCPDEIGLLIPVTGETENTAPQPTTPQPTTPQPTGLAWWTRDWYGWWQLSEGTGDYASGYWNDFADCGASFELAEDGSCILSIWDEDWGREIDGVGIINLNFTENYDGAYSTAGVFMFKDLGYSEIQITRGNAVDDATLIFGGHYEDAKGSFDYYFVLRPWGMRWDNVAYTLPKSYYDWYLPLLEAGAAHCPDTIGN